MESIRVLICLFILISVTSQLNVATAATYTVLDGLGWTFPPLGDVAYKTWAAKQKFVVGDTLVFNYTTGTHNVAEVSKASYNSCNTQSPISISNTGPTNITLSKSGEFYYICAFPNHCGAGMKLAINVSAPTTTTPAPQSPATAPAPKSPAPVSAPKSTPAPLSAPTLTPSSTPTTPPSRSPITYVVGDALGWTVPPGGPIAYQGWVANKTFIVGDTLVFNFTNGTHNVAQPTSKASYDSCNTSAASAPITEGPARITLTTPGEHFYFCTFPQHCFLGQKLAINVTGSPSPGAPGPSGNSTSPPSPPATPPGGSVPPSPSSASAVVAAIPFALLSIAFTLFY